MKAIKCLKYGGSENMVLADIENNHQETMRY
jgi:hypothetical protein